MNFKNRKVKTMALKDNGEQSSISVKVKLYRTAKGITQAELANLSNLSPAEICRIEKGERENPSIKVMTQIGKALGLNKSEFLKLINY